MNRKFLSMLVVGAATAVALAAGGNLLTNGDLSQCPCLEDSSSKEDHSNVIKVPYQVGSTELKGWTVTHDTVYLTFIKGKEKSRRWLDLMGSGGVKQSFECQPKGMCVLKFRMEGNPQGPSEQTVAIQGPGLNVQENVGNDKRRMVEVQFVPNESTATIELYGANSGRGPRIDKLSVESL